MKILLVISVVFGAFLYLNASPVAESQANAMTARHAQIANI